MPYTAKFQTHPPLQAAGTMYFAMDVDDVRAASSRPDRLSAVSGPQERVQRHTVELVHSVLGLPVLDAPVPQVEQLVEVLTMPDVEQVVEVPKLAQEDRAPVACRAPRASCGGAARGCARAAHTVHLSGRQRCPLHTLVPRCGEGRGLLVDGGQPTTSPGRYTNTGQRGLPGG